MTSEQILKMHKAARAWEPNQNAAEALEHTVGWLTHFQAYTPRAERYATLSAWTYPVAPLPELKLAYDIHAFFRFFDDFTDDMRADIRQINAVGSELTSILYDGPPMSRLGRIFDDLWTRQIANSPDQWIARIREHWAWYFSTQAAYAAMRDRRQETTVEEYLELRLGNGAVPLCLVLGEKMNSTFIPSYVHHCTQLRLMRRMASDIIVYCNDVYSSIRDDRNSDRRNLVAIICDQKNCAWREAVTLSEAEMSALDRSMTLMQERLKLTCDTLRFTDAERACVTASIKIVNDWNWGYQAWAAANELLMDLDPPRAQMSHFLTR